MTMTMSSGKETLCSQPSCPGHKIGKNKNKSYAFRECSIQKRKETEKRKNQPRKRGPKPRPKTAPMSKYRRKTANLRERLRMGEINSAFENLRQKLPNPVASGKGKCEKLTKINILHVAINYIRAMENLLETGDSGIHSFSEMTKNPLRDENDSKIEMQRILAVLMKKAEAKAAAAANGQTDIQLKEADLSRRNRRKRNFSPKNRLKQKQKRIDDFDEEDEEDDDEDDDFLDELDSQDELVQNVSFPDWKSLSSTFVPFPLTNVEEISSNPFSKNLSPIMSVATTPTSTSTPSAGLKPTSQSSPPLTFVSSSSSPSGSSVASNDCMIVPDIQRQSAVAATPADPLFSSVTMDGMSGCGGSGQNSDDLIKEFFTDFVDMVDTIPDIDFEEQFEMFP